MGTFYGDVFRVISSAFLAVNPNGVWVMSPVKPFIHPTGAVNVKVLEENVKPGKPNKTRPFWLYILNRNRYINPVDSEWEEL
ncbi:MAG: hypothetical protein D6681_06755 [Calditrichaeota bacterium]|nr:MAG: hypothetical protein D6681_06755 [Calditrichota bacterium]